MDKSDIFIEFKQISVVIAALFSKSECCVNITRDLNKLVAEIESFECNKQFKYKTC